MKELSIDEIKKIQIQILDYVDEFCKNHEIKYFLVGGTLIGAVRHKGYIPWDDDIDIMMPRDDYDRFIEKFSKESNTDYKVYSHVVQKDYPLPYAKVAYEKTIKKEDVVYSLDMGVNIDVFPSDTIPENKRLQKKLYKRFNIFYSLLQLKQIRYSSKRSLLKNLIVLTSRFLLYVIPYSYIVKRIHENAVKYRETESPLCGGAVWGYGIKEIARKEYFSELILADFEGKAYPIPKGYDPFLKNIYGNYMQLPPKEDRITHHNFKAWWK